MTKEEVVSLWGKTDLITYRTVNGRTAETCEYHYPNPIIIQKSITTYVGQTRKKREKDGNRQRKCYNPSNLVVGSGRSADLKIGSINIQKAVNERGSRKEAPKALTKKVDEFQRPIAEKQEGHLRRPPVGDLKGGGG